MNEDTVKMMDYLRVYDDEEADFIESLMTTAKIYIESMCGTDYQKDEKALILEDILIKKLVTDMYENRSTTIEGDRDIIVSSIIHKLSLYGDDNEN